MSHAVNTITVSIISMITSFAMAQEALPPVSPVSPVSPVWELSSNEIPAELQSGNIDKVDGSIALTDGAAFAIPAAAFKNPKNFTVQVTASINELVEPTLFTIMKKQGADDDGFTFALNYSEELRYSSRVHTIVNNVVMNADGIGSKVGPKSDTPYTFTVAIREGFASFYIDGKSCKKCYMEVIPNDEPMWIGLNLDEEEKPMDVVINNGLHSLHWTLDEVSDQEIHQRMSELTQSFKQGAPQAEIFYLATTPHTAKRPGPGQAVNALGAKNDMVVRLNAITRQVMREEGIEMIDVYSILSRKLELASGDGYHWQGSAYEIISNKIQKKVTSVVGRK